jgi:hypothetical protein
MQVKHEMNHEYKKPQLMLVILRGDAFIEVKVHLSIISTNCFHFE